MEDILGFLLNYIDFKYVNIFFQVIGTIYVLLLLLREFLTAIVNVTKTDKDNKIVVAIYDFIDKYSMSLNKTTKYSKIKKKK